MSGLLTLLVAATAADAAPVAFDRVELLSEASPSWLGDELPRITTAPGVTALRYVEQVAVVAGIGPRGEVGIGFDAQWLGARAAIGPRRTLSFDGAVVTRAMLPVGGRVGVAWRPGPLRIGVSLVALAEATWVRPSYRGWDVAPALGVGLGRTVARRAPWMDPRD